MRILTGISGNIKAVGREARAAGIGRGLLPRLLHSQQKSIPSLQHCGGEVQHRVQPLSSHSPPEGDSTVLRCHVRAVEVSQHQPGLTHCQVRVGAASECREIIGGLQTARSQTL